MNYSRISNLVKKASTGSITISLTRKILQGIVFIGMLFSTLGMTNSFPETNVTSSNLLGLSDPTHFVNVSSKPVYLVVQDNPTGKVYILQPNSSYYFRDVEAIWAQCNEGDYRCFDNNGRWQRVYKLGGIIGSSAIFTTYVETGGGNGQIILTGTSSCSPLDNCGWVNPPQEWPKPEEDIPYTLASCAKHMPVAASDPDHLDSCPSPQLPPSFDMATFIQDITIPDGTVVSPNQLLTKAWRVKNSGSSTWSGYKLKFVDGEQMNGPAEITLPTTTPGEIKDISLNLNAPTSTGIHSGIWQITKNDGTWVPGGNIWITINVQGDSTIPTSTPSASLNGIELVNISTHNVQPGEKFNPSVTIRVTSGYLDPARGDHLHATSEDSGNTMGAWPVQAVKSYVGTGQTYTFNVSNDSGFQMTAPSTPGNYQSVWQLRVGGNHIGPQAIIHINVGMPNRAPSSPTARTPNDWAEIHSQQAPELCWDAVGDPDGDPVQYFVEIYQSAVGDNSGWINGTCWRPNNISGHYFGYQWHVRAKDNRGGESGYGNTIHFTLSPPLYDPRQPTSIPQSVPTLPIQTGYSWDSAYLYRRPLIISTNDDLKAGVVIKVDGLDLETLVAAGKIRADHNDLRVVRRLSDNTWQEVPRIYYSGWDIEFQLLSDIYPGIDTSYYLYYGNPNAGSPPTFSQPNGWYVDMYLDKWWESWGGTWEYNQTIDFNNSCESPLNHNTKLNSSFDDSDKYRGRVFVPSTGTWTFSVYTNDGYRLSIDGVELGRFDGYTGERWVTVGSINLTAGWHWMDARNMWVNCGPWKLAMSGPGFGNQIIPASYYQKSWGNVKTGVSPSAEEPNIPVTNTPTPTVTYTPTLTPTSIPTSTPVPTSTPLVTTTPNQSPIDSSLFNFEDGTTQDWSYGESITGVTNTTSSAYLGTHSLCATSDFIGGEWDSGYAFVNQEVVTGDTITAKMYVPSGYNGISTSIYLQDANWGWYESSFTGLTPGTWTTLTWDLSGLGFATPTNRIGFHIGSNSSYQGCVYIDSVDIVSEVSPTQTPTLMPTNTLTPVPTFTSTKTNTPLPTATLTPTSTLTLVSTNTFTPVPNFTSTNTNTSIPSPTASLQPTSTASNSGTELLSQPWHLVGNNGATELYQSISSNALQGKDKICVTYDLHGLNALGGDASAIIFDQSGWKYVSLSNYGQNGLNGVQTVCIPLSDFPGLNPSASVGTLHTRFWYSGPFTVDITNIKVYSSSNTTPTVTSTATYTLTPVNTLTPTQNSGSGTLTFYPVADASVFANAPTTNYGNGTTLETDNDPVETFLLKFNVVGLNGTTVTNAKLRLYNVNGSDFGGYFYKITDNSWTENGVTYNTRPAYDSSTTYGSLGAVNTTNWYEVDLTSLITGNGTYGIRVKSTSGDGADYSSREGANPPQLVITFSGSGAPTPTIVFTPTVTKTPTNLPTATVTPIPTLTSTPIPTAISGVELLSQPWHLVGNNGATELYQSISSNALQGKVKICITYDLHGLNALGGDASAIIFDQSGWKYVSLSKYGQNGLNGVQTVCIPLSDFPGLNPSASVGTLHTRFWYSGPFTVDITSIKVYSS